MRKLITEGFAEAGVAFPRFSLCFPTGTFEAKNDTCSDGAQPTQIQTSKLAPSWCELTPCHFSLPGCPASVLVTLRECRGNTCNQCSAFPGHRGCNCFLRTGRNPRNPRGLLPLALTLCAAVVANPRTRISGHVRTAASRAIHCTASEVSDGSNFIKPVLSSLRHFTASVVMIAARVKTIHTDAENTGRQSTAV